MTEMSLGFAVVLALLMAFAYKFTYTTNVYENVVTDQKVPYLQALSYSGISDGCNGTVYDMVALAAAGNLETISLCGEDFDVEDEIMDKLENGVISALSDMCLEYTLYNSSDEKMFTIYAGPGFENNEYDSCSDYMKKIMGGTELAARTRTSTTYIIALPPAADGSARLAKHGLISYEVETG